MRHPFVEDQPFGDRDRDFFGFGHDGSRAVWIAFSDDMAPVKLRERGQLIDLSEVPDDLLAVIATVEEVLAESDPEEA